MELRQYFQILWKWSWLIALSVIIAAGSSFLASRAATPLYRTRTTLMVGRVTQNPDPNSADLYTGQQLAYTYAQMATRELVLKGALESLGLPMSWQELAGQVSAYTIPQTQLIEISVIDTDPVRAKAISGAVAEQLILISPAGTNTNDQEQIAFALTQLKDLKGKIEQAQSDLVALRKQIDASNSARQIQDMQNQIDTLEKKISGWQETYSKLLVTVKGGDVNALVVVEEASVPSQPISPNIKMNVLLAAAIGLALALGGIIIIEYLDDSIKTSEDITLTQQLPVIGIIGRIDGEAYPDKLIALHDPLSPVVESFRSLVVNLHSSFPNGSSKAIIVSSAKPKEGKSVTTSNLAVVLAQSGQKVIIVDADLRLPVLHQIFKLPNKIGLSDALMNGQSDVREYLQTTAITNLRVLTSGPLLPNPTQALGANSMPKVLEALKSESDVVLIDAPPLLSVADALTLGIHVDGGILVFFEGQTQRNEARRVIEKLRAARINIIGVVLRKSKERIESYSHYYYYAGSEGAKKRHKKPFTDWTRRSRSAGRDAD
jgi:polysaccharide biosynthesis transport protein